jgi:DNA-binding transcriptional LysR family regulator
MNLRSVDLNLLPVFDAIYTEGNLSRAARKLAMSQPALSNALARLRLTLQDPLFLRTSKGMRPTSRARLLAEPIRHALDLVQNALRANADFDYFSSKRTFVVAVEDYGEAVILPRFIEWVREVAPGIRIKVRPERSLDLKEALRQGEVDLAIDYFPIRESDFENRRLLTDVLVSMVRHDHSTVGDHLNLEQFVALPHVVLEQRSRPVIDVALGKKGLKRNVAVVVPHFLSMPLIVKGSSLICSLPKRMAMIYAEYFRLKVLTTPVEFPPIPIFLVTHRSLENDAAHRWLRESLAELCARL